MTRDRDSSPEEALHPHRRRRKGRRALRVPIDEVPRPAARLEVESESGAQSDLDVDLTSLAGDIHVPGYEPTEDELDHAPTVLDEPSPRRTNRSISSRPSRESASGNVVVSGTLRISSDPPALDSAPSEERTTVVDEDEDASPADTLRDRKFVSEETPRVSLTDLEIVEERLRPRTAPPPPPAPPKPPIEPTHVAAVKSPGSIPPPPPSSPAVRSPDSAPNSGSVHTSDDPDPGRTLRRRKRRPWFEDFFTTDYLRTVARPRPVEVARQCDFIESVLGLEHGATILDVGCGLGLQATELASRGYSVVGLDLSTSMLQQAQAEADDRGYPVKFVHGDMREMTVGTSFDAVLCWGTTFGYFDEEGNRGFIRNLYNALKPRGLLLLDIVNRDHVMPSQPNVVWFEGNGCVCMEETKFNYIASRLEVKRTVILDDGRQWENGYSIRLYSLHEIGQILHNAGFRVAEVSGREWTRGVFLGADSPRMIILAERRPPDEPNTDEGRPSHPPPPSSPPPPTDS